ncbi:MAG: putative holliday junction resolvase [Parcubacteria group bacterium Gr01-1014_70]|nr:MAG: putative holliday junction resolvase [Parcubacteria group bacterium Gr01-1014_70]
MYWRLKWYMQTWFLLDSLFIIHYSYSMKLLGIDYGTKRFGFAVGDTDQKIAFPRSVMEGRAKAIDYVDKMIDQEGVKKVVIGIPVRHSGEEGELAADIRAFAKKITEKLGVEVVFQNEILSTKAIQQGTVSREKTDAASAALILQSYLDKMIK